MCVRIIAKVGLGQKRRMRTNGLSNAKQSLNVNDFISRAPLVLSVVSFKLTLLHLHHFSSFYFRGVDAFLGWATALVTVLTDPTQGIVAGCVLASAVAAVKSLRREVLTKTASE